MDTGDLAQYYKMYLDTLDNTDKNEWYDTNQDIAEDVILGFLRFIDTQDEINEAIAFLKQHGYTVTYNVTPEIKEDN